MTTIDTGVIGFDVEVHVDHVILNDKVKITRPKGCSVSNWETVWGRMDKEYGHVESVEQEGHVVVEL